MRETAEVATLPADWLGDIKQRVSAARQRAALAANAELVQLYWQIGQDILQRQQTARWGDKVLVRLAADLRETFPEMKGFSLRNLKYMRYFAEHCPQQTFGRQPAAQLPWFHIVTLLTKLSDEAARAWYAAQAVADGWSCATLEVQIRNRLMERQGRAVSNFETRLPAPHSELARALPEPLVTNLPTVEQLESELADWQGEEE